MIHTINPVTYSHWIQTILREGRPPTWKILEEAREAGEAIEKWLSTGQKEDRKQAVMELVDVATAVVSTAKHSLTVTDQEWTEAVKAVNEKNWKRGYLK